MIPYTQLRQQLGARPRRWLITGVAGFIGSHLLEALLTLDQHVVGLDDFSSGAKANLDEVQTRVGGQRWEQFRFCKGSVADLETCQAACANVDYVLHEAGFVSVPLSLENPLACHATNVTGTLNMLLAARGAGVKRVVYASSSAVYGDDARLPKTEAQTGRPLSPYGASKRMAEIYAEVVAGQFGVESVGLRYFNIFGPRQNPAGGYAAVIPQWIGRMLRGEECVIHGSGGITRDFCPVADVVQANLLAATGELAAGSERVFNVALGGRTTLDQLHALLGESATRLGFAKPLPVRYGPPREGDIMHSAADITAIRQALGFAPSASIAPALKETFQWYASAAKSSEPSLTGGTSGG
jgi:UDP-N-acetylglucosamine 4-epimerase